MIILAIDTSTKFLSLALADGEKGLGRFHRDLGQRHCAEIVPLIEGLLKKARLKLDDLDCFAVSKGPGSFTGLRIGIAAVKAYALATDKPVVGVPSLDVLAHNARGYRGFIVPVVDARRDNVYGSVYSFGAAGMRRHIGYAVLPVEELLRRIRGRALFLGDGLIRYKDLIRERFKFGADFAKEKDWYPKATVVAKLGVDLYRKKIFEEPDKMAPLYLYPRDIQVTGVITGVRSRGDTFNRDPTPTPVRQKRG